MDVQTFDPAQTDPAGYEKALARVAASSAAAVQGTQGARPDIDWKNAFASTLMDGTGFTSQQIPERPPLLGAFLRAGDFGFIYAPRGVGKTWMALTMAGAIARGTSLGEWEAGTAGPQRVCYVDGEVNLPDAIERAVLTDLPANVHWLHHEQVADTTGSGFNLTDPAQQRGLLEMLIEHGIAVLFLDNLSCLFRGMAENEADAWEMAQPWLLDLRRNHITVIVVAHAGRNGQMRGTSRREDAAHWILKLEDAGDSESDGAEFKSRFTKNRNARNAAASCPPLHWKMTTKANRLTIECTRHSDVDALVDLVRGGITKASDLAEELGVTKGTISKWARKAQTRGLIRIENRVYKPA
jgi:putative DNA primase/helicase